MRASLTIFFNVPKSTGLFSVQLRMAKRDVPGFSSPAFDLEADILRYVFFTVHDPRGQWALPYSTPSVNASGLWSQAFAHPVPGVWEVTINNRPFGQFSVKPKSLGSAPYTLTARALSLGSVRPTVVGSSTITYAIQNRMAPVRLKVLDAPLGRLRRMQLTLTPTEPRKVIPIDVPAAATQVQAMIADLGNNRSDVDVYLFDCAKNNLGKNSYRYHRYPGACEFKVSANARDGGIARYEGTDVFAGRWVAVVDARRIDGTSANVQYSDVVVDAAYGTGRITAAPPFLPAGATTAVTVRVVRGRPVPQGTELVAVPLLGAQDGMLTYTTVTTGAAYMLKNPPVYRTWPTLWETITSLVGRVR